MIESSARRFAERRRCEASDKQCAGTTVMWPTMALAVFLVASCGGGGSDGSNASAPTPAPAPDPGTNPPAPTGTATTAIGEPVGMVTTQRIGSGGGVVASPGDRIVLTIPPGSLAAPTDITIQAIANPMPGGIGQAFRLGPDGTSFAVPIRITMNLSGADLNGTAARFLRIASQNAAREWRAEPGKQTIDAAAKSVTVTSSHFSDWGVQATYLLTPAAAVLRPNESLPLLLSYCSVVPDRAGNGVSVLEYCKTSTPSPSPGDFAGVFLTEWRLNQYPLAGAPSELGGLTPSGLRANYQAPAAVPSTNPVAVSALLTDGVSPGEIRLVSNITISDPPGYSGAAEVRKVETAAGIRIVTSSQAGVTFILNRERGTYEPFGSVNISKRGTLGDCTFSAHGGQDFSPDGVSGLGFVPAAVPSAGKYYGSGNVLPVLLTGTQVCADGVEKAYSASEPWSWWQSVDASPTDSLLTPKPDGTLSEYSERQVDAATLRIQSFKFVPTRR